MKPIFTICTLFIFACAGCTASAPEPVAEKTIETSNKGMTVEQLFTDPAGTTVYRFWSFGDWRYYTYNPHGVSQIMPTTKIVYVTDTDTSTDLLEDDDHHHHDHHDDHHSSGGKGHK